MGAVLKGAKGPWTIFVDVNAPMVDVKSGGSRSKGPRKTLNAECPRYLKG